MKRQNGPISNKPSEPEAGLAEIRKNLDALKQLTKDSAAIAAGIEHIMQKLSAPLQEQGAVFATIGENLTYLQDCLGKDIGLVLEKYSILQGKAQVGIAYITSISDMKQISSQVLEPLQQRKFAANTTAIDLPLLIQSQYIPAAGIKNTTGMKQVFEGILNGDTALFVDGSNTALLVASRKIEQRGVEKPLNEGTVLASLDSFTESLDTNCGMIIRRLPISALRFETFDVGKLAPTKIKLAWLEGIANPTIVDEARRRINRINIDYISGIGTLAELIEDSPFSIFPKYRQTERPDTTAKALTDGNFAILCNNSPFALFAPISLWDNLKTMDDYAERTTSASYLRLARYAAFLLSILISPLYLSFVTYNHTIIPQTLGIAIAAGRAGVPFPSAAELLAMTLAITIIREAAMRIPGSVGYFVGTLAAVIIGQASVAAGYVSASVIIVVAASEISSFAISTTTLVYTSRLINYFLIVLSSMFGMFGLINGIAIVFWHLASLESFGVPYLYPLVPFELAAMQDTFVRFSILRKRFKILAPFNRMRTSK